MFYYNHKQFSLFGFLVNCVSACACIYFEKPLFIVSYKFESFIDNVGAIVFIKTFIYKYIFKCHQIFAYLLKNLTINCKQNKYTCIFVVLHNNVDETLLNIAHMKIWRLLFVCTKMQTKFLDKNIRCCWIKLFV